MNNDIRNLAAGASGTEINEKVNTQSFIGDDNRAYIQIYKDGAKDFIKIHILAKKDRANKIVEKNCIDFKNRNYLQ